MDLPEKLKGKNTPVEKIVLLLAALEKNGSIPSADYKLMSALSGGQYTPSALEHQFRDLRKAASDLLKKNPDITGKDAVTSSPKKRQSTSVLFPINLYVYNTDRFHRQGEEHAE